MTPRLTPHMRHALTTARTGEIRRTLTPGPGAPPWPHPAATLYALERHELVVRSERRNRRGEVMIVWAISDAGRQALEPEEIIKTERPLYLASIVGERGDYTPIQRRAMDPLEVTDVRELNTRWCKLARARHSEARGRLNRPPGQRPPHPREEAARFSAEQDRLRREFYERKEAA